jgi:UDP-glucose 4-epimerase
MWKAAILPEASKEIINLGGTVEYSIKEASEILKDVIGECEVVFKEGRHEVKRSMPTWQKSVDILGFEHKTHLRDGLESMWKWAQEQPQRKRLMWEKYELDTGIYSYWKK